MSQPATSATPYPAGYKIEPIQPMDIEAYLGWLLDEPGAAIPQGSTGLIWALAHCDDGVTWGGRNGSDSPKWNFGNQFFPKTCPAIRRERLQELRIFGENAEVLIWRTDVRLRGRVLREGNPPVDRNDKSNPLRPFDEWRIVRGDWLAGEAKSGFCPIADGTGTEQIIPIAVSDEQLKKRSVRLCVRHYYEQDDESGSVRIAATRLVKLTAEGTTNGS